VSISFDPEVYDFLNNPTKTTGLARSELVNLAVAKLIRREAGYAKARKTPTPKRAPIIG
jgi:hypothetical protein